MSSAAEPTIRSGKTRFLLNVAWGWLGVAVNIVIGIVLSPIIIKKLGVERYGVWVLLFSTMDYLRMLDFGFRAAVVNGCARCRARADWDGVNRTIAPAMLYFLLIGGACCALAIGLRDVAINLFNIPAAMKTEARTLIIVIAVSVSLRLILSPLTATLEAFQRFDVVHRAYISALLFRSIGSLTVLLLGYGLVEMGYVLLIAQIGENLLNFIGVKRVFPGFRFSVDLVQMDAVVALFRYGRHSAAMGAANLISIQVPTTVLDISAARLRLASSPYRSGY